MRRLQVRRVDGGSPVRSGLADNGSIRHGLSGLPGKISLVLRSLYYVAWLQDSAVSFSRISAF